MALLSVQWALPNTPVDSISRFHFQKMMLEDDCDACGCSANGGSMGFSSMFQNHFVGVRYFYQHYRSKDGIFANSPWVVEDFNTIQVWARIPIARNVQLSVLVPYHFHTRFKSEGDENIEGLGDLTLLGMYKMYETDNDSTFVTHRLQLGGGVKVPTGKYNLENNKGSVNPGFQVGTGSWDYLLAAEYVLKRHELGFNAMATYVFKTENRKLYRFGNQFNYSGTLFYLWETDWLKLVPQAGIAGETFEGNTQYEQPVPDSSGKVLFGKFGVEAGRKKWSVGFNLLSPIDQKLSAGNVEAGTRWSVNLNYSL